VKYKLIVFDLDGTLLREDGSITSRTVEYINKLKKNQFDVIIATGRSYYHAKKLIEPLKQDMIILSNNGSIARHTSNDEIIFANYLDRHKTIDVIKEAKKKILSPILHVDKYENGYDLLIEEESESKNYSGYVSNKEGRYRRIEFENDRLDKVLAVCFAGDFYELENFRSKIKKKYPGIYNSFTSKNLRVRGLLEFLDLKGCKWEGVLRYAKSKGIEKEQIISLGDDNNDIELIKKSAIGIAMKNGTNEIKLAADLVAYENNNNDGAVKVLEKIFKLEND